MIIYFLITFIIIILLLYIVEVYDNTNIKSIKRAKLCNPNNKSSHSKLRKYQNIIITPSPNTIHNIEKNNIINNHNNHNSDDSDNTNNREEEIDNNHINDEMINNDDIILYVGYPKEHNNVNPNNLFLIQGNIEMLNKVKEYGKIKNIKQNIKHIEYTFRLYYDKHITPKGNLCKIFNMYYTNSGYVPYSVEYELSDGREIEINYKNEILE